MIKDLTIKVDGVTHRITIWNSNFPQFVLMQKTERRTEDYAGFILAENLKMWMGFDSGSQLLPSGSVFHKTLEHFPPEIPSPVPLCVHFKAN